MYNIKISTFTMSLEHFYLCSENNFVHFSNNKQFSFLFLIVFHDIRLEKIYIFL